MQLLDGPVDPLTVLLRLHVCSYLLELLWVVDVDLHVMRLETRGASVVVELELFLGQHAFRIDISLRRVLPQHLLGIMSDVDWLLLNLLCRIQVQWWHARLLTLVRRFTQLGVLDEVWVRIARSLLAGVQLVHGAVFEFDIAEAAILARI